MTTQTVKHRDEYGKKALGRSELHRHLKGGKLTGYEAMRAKCYDCMANYADGLIDCEMNDCPLYPFFPYKGKKLESF